MRFSETTAALNDAVAKARLKIKMPTKNKINPRFNSAYADLAALLDAIVPIYCEHGVTIWQGTSATEYGIMLTTRVSHKNEWMESYYPVCKYDTPQNNKSALTYAKRAGLELAGLVCGDDDLDGEDSKDVKTNVNGSRITDAQLTHIEDLLVETGSDPIKFQQYFKIKTLADLSAADFDRAVASLEKKKVAA